MTDDYEADDEHELAVLLSARPDLGTREIERQICAVSTKSPLDEVCAAIDAADWLLARARTIHRLSRQQAISWIEHNGEFHMGSVRFSVGYATTTRCVDSPRCGHELLKALGGDFDGYMQTLVAQPYKSGSASRTLDPSVYRSCFSTKSAARLVNGVPERILKQTDTRFTTNRAKLTNVRGKAALAKDPQDS